MDISVIEIRNYVIKPPMTQHFIDNFEAHFLASQEAVGMAVLGQFRVVDQPDHFVWLRGFANMDTRRAGLQSFYTGPVWKKLGPFTNSMLIDSDHVHLLRPCGDSAALTAGVTTESVANELAAGTLSPATGLVAIDFYHVAVGQPSRLVEQVRGVYENRGIQVRGVFVTEMQPNDFPRLPVIQDPDLVVVITVYANATTLHEQRADWAEQLHSDILTRPPDFLLLEPTLRSPLRYGPSESDFQGR